jgi:hypothetical protein
MLAQLRPEVRQYADEWEALIERRRSLHSPHSVLRLSRAPPDVARSASPPTALRLSREFATLEGEFVARAAPRGAAPRAIGAPAYSTRPFAGLASRSRALERLAAERLSPPRAPPPATLAPGAQHGGGPRARSSSPVRRRASTVPPRFNSAMYAQQIARAAADFRRAKAAHGVSQGRVAGNHGGPVIALRADGNAFADEPVVRDAGGGADGRQADETASDDADDSAGESDAASLEPSRRGAASAARRESPARGSAAQSQSRAARSARRDGGAAAKAAAQWRRLGAGETDRGSRRSLSSSDGGGGGDSNGVASDPCADPGPAFERGAPLRPRYYYKLVAALPRWVGVAGPAAPRLAGGPRRAGQLTSAYVNISDGQTAYRVGRTLNLSAHQRRRRPGGHAPGFVVYETVEAALRCRLPRRSKHLGAAPALLRLAVGGVGQRLGGPRQRRWLFTQLRPVEVIAEGPDMRAVL